MKIKNFILVGLVLVLAVVYAVYFTDWFRPNTIHISSTSRPVRTVRAFRAGRPGAPSRPIRPGATQLFFDLKDDYELTELKVVPLAALQTNKLAQPVWHLVGQTEAPTQSKLFLTVKHQWHEPRRRRLASRTTPARCHLSHVHHRRKNQRSARYPHRRRAGQHGRQPVITVDYTLLAQSGLRAASIFVPAKWHAAQWLFQNLP